ncbi:TPA: hypothetical protein DEP58_00225 [Patescibacteria group bacterium]|nr:MAG: hypothetical protein UU98_C0027G0043 [Parcubacteria group bacterium GW2011_GWD2_42_14]HCC04713.1 hypothetical protein [Patescibacteria group bacterium]
MQKQHLVVIILFVFTLLLGVVSFLLPKEVVSPTPEHIQPTTPTTTDIYTMEPIVPEAKVSTEGWKTCRNEEYGWEVKYPEGWYVWGTDGEKNPYSRSIYSDSPSGNCVGVGVGMTNNIEFGDREQKSISVITREQFLYHHPEVEASKRPSVFMLEELLADFKTTGTPVGASIVDDMPAIYTIRKSNSLTGGYITELFLDHPSRGAIQISLTNIDVATRDTILSTIVFSTSTGELDWSKL